MVGGCFVGCFSRLVGTVHGWIDILGGMLGWVVVVDGLSVVSMAKVNKARFTGRESRPSRLLDF